MKSSLKKIKQKLHHNLHEKPNKNAILIVAFLQFLFFFFYNFLQISVKVEIRRFERQRICREKLDNLSNMSLKVNLGKIN